MRPKTSPHIPHRLRALAAALVVAATVPAIAQSDGASVDATMAPAAAPTAAPVEAGDLRIADAWTRQPPPGARAGGGYATITNTGAEADRLVGGSVPFAERFEVHEMSVQDGVMRMSELGDGLPIAPGETVVLRPGGFHLMFIGITDPPAAGDTVPVTLLFERAGEVTLDLPVAGIGAAGPGGAEEMMDHGVTGHDALEATQ